MPSPDPETLTPRRAQGQQGCTDGSPGRRAAVEPTRVKPTRLDVTPQEAPRRLPPPRRTDEVRANGPARCADAPRRPEAARRSALEVPPTGPVEPAVKTIDSPIQAAPPATPAPVVPEAPAPLVAPAALTPGAPRRPRSRTITVVTVLTMIALLAVATAYLARRGDQVVRVGHCITVTRASAGQTADIPAKASCDDSAPTYTVVQDVGDGTCAEPYLEFRIAPEGKRASSWCLMPNLVAGHCYQHRDAPGSPYGLTVVDCSSPAAQVSVTRLADDVADASICPEPATTLVFAEAPRRTYCTALPG